MKLSQEVRGAAIYEKYHLWHSAAKLSEGMLTQGKVTCTRGAPQNQREKPLALPVSLQCPLLTKLNIAPAGKRLFASPAVTTEQTERRAGLKAERKLTTGTIYKDESPWTVFSDKFLNCVQFMVMIASPHPPLFSNSFFSFLKRVLWFSILKYFILSQQLQKIHWSWISGCAGYHLIC